MAAQEVRHGRTHTPPHRHRSCEPLWRRLTLLAVAVGLNAAAGPAQPALADVPRPPSPTACKDKQPGDPCEDSIYEIVGTCKRVSECYLPAADGTCLLCADAEGLTALEGGGQVPLLGPSQIFFFGRMMVLSLMVVVPVLLLAAIVGAVLVVIALARRRERERERARSERGAAVHGGEGEADG